ncbi:kinase-like protein [Aspergillus venezuelensis]
MGSEEGEVLHSLVARKVVKISDTLVVKSGPNLGRNEVDTLRFIAENTTIPVPKVHHVQEENEKQLHSYVLQLRALKGTYIGGVERGTAIIGKRTSVEGGPFESEKKFNEFILADIVRIAPDLLRHYAKHALLDTHEIVFTHGDLAPRNILVDDSGNVTAVLDWEYAGWYPEHWEYIKALVHLRPMPDWPEYLSMILPPKYEQEYIGMTFLGLFLRH